MKKTILLVALLLAVPAMAAVDLSCVIEVDGSVGTLTISYDASGEVELARAFGLDVEVTGAVIADVNWTNPDYYIYPGTIVIVDGNVTSYGSPVAPANDPGALGDLPGTQCTIEMGSLYVDANLAPGAADGLIQFNLSGISGAVEATVTTNETRGMIVLEDATSVDANCVCAIGGDPECWGYPTQCYGDTNGDGSVGMTDFLAFKDSWLKDDPDPDYDPCADFNHDGAVGMTDFLVFKDNWLTDPPADCP